MSKNFEGWRSFQSKKEKTDPVLPGFRRVTPQEWEQYQEQNKPAPAAAPKEKSLSELRKEHQRQAMALRIRERKYEVIVGIDPGVDTGFAVWHKINRQLLRVETLTISQAWREILLLQEWYGRAIMVRVEDARLRTYLPKEKNESEYRGRLMGAGSVKRDCKAWEDFLDEIGIDYELVKPRKGMTKWTPAQFVQRTGWKGVTSNHARDAVANIYGL